jgi:hypothetical protein
MLTLERDSGTGQLTRAFAAGDARLKRLEERINRGESLPLADTVEQTIALIRDLITAYLVEDGKKQIPDSTVDLLEIFKALVKGEPSWHAIRDNCRELVYYRNCINMQQQDALPPVPEKMAVRAARHVYLYVRTRCIREGRLQDG